MKNIFLFAVFVCVATIAVAGVPRGGSSGVSTVRMFNWQTYIDKDILKDFASETGIAPVYNEYDDNSILDARVMRRSSGYDVVVPSAQPYFARQIKAGAYQPLDKSKIPNLSKLDPNLMRLVQNADPENIYGVIYLWGTTGILFNVDMVRERLKDIPLDSWDIIFKPENIAKLKDCGVAFLDSPVEIYPIVFRYLGINPNTTNLADLIAAEKTMTAIRSSVKYFHSSRYIDDLANGRLCAVVGYSGDFVSARNRTTEGNSISYIIPREGTVVWFDVMAIPVDAPDVEAAHKLINYILQPQVMAKISNAVGFANAVPEADAFTDPAIKTDPLINPTNETRQKLFALKEIPAEFERAMQQSWARMRASGSGGS